MYKIKMEIGKCIINGVIYRFYLSDAWEMTLICCFEWMKRWTKTETMKGSNKRKSFIEPVGMNGSNFKNKTLFVSFTDIITTWISHPFLVVMIAVKDKKSVSILKLEPFIPTASTSDFLLFDPFIVSVFVQQGRTKAVTSHLFTPLFMSIHLPLIHFAAPPRLLIDFKNSKRLTYFAYYYAFVIVSLTWLAHTIISLI